MSEELNIKGIRKVIEKLINLRNTYKLEGMSPMGDDELHTYKVSFSPLTTIFTMDDDSKERYRKVWGYNSIDDNAKYFGVIKIQVDQIIIEYMDENDEIDSFIISKPIVKDIKYGFDLISQIEDRLFSLLPKEIFNVDFEILDSNGVTVYG